MKSVFLIVASVFALSAIAQTAPIKKEETKASAPAKVEAKKDAQPSKSAAPAVKETKTATPASK
jgi:hypothetical protein